MQEPIRWGMNTPALLAKEAAERAGRDMVSDLKAFLCTGYVFSTPTAFVMAKPTARFLAGNYDDPWFMANPDEYDTWLVWLAAGDMAEFFRFCPYPLSWLAWARHDRLRFWRFESIQSKVTSYHGRRRRTETINQQAAAQSG